MRRLSSALIALLISGCATHLPKQAPKSNETGAFVSSRLPLAWEKQVRTSLQNTYFGTSGASGNAAAGLLLGPLGVMANAAYVDAENERRSASLKPLTSQNLAEILRASVPELGDSGRGRGPYELVPAAGLEFTSAESYSIRCTIAAHSNTSEAWNALYRVGLEETYDVRRPSDTDKAIAALAPCLRAAHRLFREHLVGSLGPFGTRTITIKEPASKDSITVSHNISAAALPERIIINDALGLVQMRRLHVVGVK